MDKDNLKVNIPEHLRAASSANVIRVTTTHYGEVLIDFVFAHPEDKDKDGRFGTVVSRVAVPMQVAKDLHAILESHLGKIKKE